MGMENYDLTPPIQEQEENIANGEGGSPPEIQRSFIGDDRHEYINGVKQPAPFAPYLMNQREVNNLIDFVESIEIDEDRKDTEGAL